MYWPPLLLYNWNSSQCNIELNLGTKLGEKYSKIIIVDEISFFQEDLHISNSLILVGFVFDGFLTVISLKDYEILKKKLYTNMSITKGVTDKLAQYY